MKNVFLVFLSLLLFSGLTFAQNSVKGKVTTTSGESIPGVNIVIKGTTTGTITDIDGNYVLNVADPNNVQLVFSFIGFQAQTIELKGKTQINVQLEETTQGLDEVVVVGYGEIRKRDLTGSVSKVVETENVSRQYNTVDAMLQGRAAGVQVSSNAGAPGGAISVRIRGTNSLRGNNEPLYVIDGVIISSAGEDVSNASTDSNELQTDQNGLTGLNPRDIENIEILKDASATAIYGSRGANGVVLITTKQGKENKGKAKINAYVSTDFSWVAKKIDVLDPVSYAEYQNESKLALGFKQTYQVNGNSVYPLTYQQDPVTGEDIPVVGSNPLTQIDWQDEIYKLAVSHNEGMSISGKKDKTNYYFSAGLNNTQGVVETTNIKQGDIRLNLTTDLSSKLKFDNRFSMMYQTGTFAQAGSKSGGNRSFTKQVLTYRPVIGNTDENSDEMDLEISNPYAWLQDFDDLTEETRINYSTYLEYELIKGLKYKISGGLDYRTKDRSRWYGLGVFVGGQNNGLANYSNLKRYSYSFDNVLNYIKRFGKDHSLNAVAAITYNGSNIKNEVYEVIDFPVKTLRSEAPQLGQIVQRPFSYINSKEEIFSALSRINYSFKDKYILTASFRADQSSKFASDKQWGYFPSAAVAWRMNEESWIKDLDIFYNLKMRLGWGQTGNQAISPYQTLSTYDTEYYVSATGATIIGSAPARIANPDLRWETTNQINAGFDVSVFKGRLNATIDAYYKKTKDLLQDIQLPNSTGFGSMTINRGEIENKGIELSLDGSIIRKKDFGIDAGAHVSFNRTKVVKLGLPSSPVWANGQESQEVYYLGNNVSTGTYFKAPANIFMEGQQIGMFWGYKTNGVYQDQTAADAGPGYFGNPNSAGDLIFVDQNNDGNIGAEDLTFIGNPNPDFTFGFDFTVRYKGLSLKALFDGVYGNDIANGYNLELGFPETNSKNILTDTYKNTWRADAPSNKVPRMGYSMINQGFPDVIVEDGSYLRLSNITLGYDLPVKLSFIDNINIYASARNVFYITNYSGYEPQITSFLYDGTIMGVDWVGTPNVKSVLFGLNLTF